MARLLPDDQVCESYRLTRAAVLDVLDGTPESSATLIVPACPAWTVQQIASHLVGVPEDLLAGRMEGITSEAWTNAQVQRHSGESLAELSTALNATIVPFDAMLPAIGSPSNSQLVMDTVTHEIDLREALGLECAESSLALSVAKAWLLKLVERRDQSLIDDLESARISDLGLVRALTGRTTISEMDRQGFSGSRIAAALEGTPLRPPT